MELRKDYILDRWVIISESRKKRPREFVQKQESLSGAVCVFCPGNEHLTPAEKGRIGEPWKVRWFDNLFAFAELKGSPNIQTHNEFYTFGNPFGEHEIIVETPDHAKQLWDLSVDELLTVLKAWCNRISELSQKPATKWVAAFKNHGKEGGASLMHSHSQIVSFNLEPPQVMAEINASRNYSGCPYCKLMENEKKSHRRVKETGSFASFTPYASRFNYETWIFPKKHTISLLEFSNDELREMAEHIKHILSRLKTIDIPYNLFLHYPPKGHDLHFHIEITPRGGIWAGFEFTTAITINSISPEFAASFLRGEVDEQGNPQL